MNTRIQLEPRRLAAVALVAATLLQAGSAHAQNMCQNCDSLSRWILWFVVALFSLLAVGAVAARISRYLRNRRQFA